MAARTTSSKAGGVSSYARGKWAASDSVWCDQMDAVQSLDVRADVVDAMLRVLRRCHASMWPADHWSKACKHWGETYRGHALPAFQVSGRELAEATGLSRNRIRTALRVAEERGVIVRLSDHAPRGEGRGSIPATYAFACYLRSNADTTKPKVESEPKPKVAARNTASKWGFDGDR